MNQDNLLKIEECFRAGRITAEISDSSITKYRDSIRKFFAVVGDVKIEDLSVRDFEDFILKMRDNGASNSRIANVISGVKWVIKKLQDEGKIPDTLDLAKVKKPKIDKKKVVYLSENEIRLFLDAIENDNLNGVMRQYRARALFFFLLRTGARIGEALSINISDIDRQNKEIEIIGKGNKPRTLFLADDALDRIDQYLNMRKDGNKALFVSLSGSSRWQQTDVGRSFRRYKIRSGIKKKITIHTLRHTFATQLLLKGAPINSVQFFLGHSDLETTMKYYIGAIEKQAAKLIIMDKHFDFIPESAIKN